jgi:hypothetical protein
MDDAAPAGTTRIARRSFAFQASRAEIEMKIEHPRLFARARADCAGILRSQDAIQLAAIYLSGPYRPEPSQR